MGHGADGSTRSTAAVTIGASSSTAAPEWSSFDGLPVGRVTRCRVGPPVPDGVPFGWVVVSSVSMGTTVRTPCDSPRRPLTARRLRPNVVEVNDTTGVRVGSAVELRTAGRLTGKVGSLPVVVFWHEGRAWAIEDRCPHMGFPLHQGTVEEGMVTCHWHHARFDLASGCTLDPFADDARGFDVVCRR